ncbi:MAG: ComF family protein [Alistipes sp.]|nr:ComF family protein [Alistipes sp.]
MSILNDMMRDVLSLVAPASCPVCGKWLGRGEAVVCASCEVMAPLTNLWREPHNPMNERFWGLMPVERASAFLWYVEGSAWRDVVHNFKYGGQWRVAYNMGRWFGAELRESGLYDDVDVVVPVPLHLARRMWRGYNQSEYIARGIARELGVKVDVRSVSRHKYNSSQTHHSKDERWDNVEGIFRVRRADALRGKHILLVDDVFTTGATIMSLGETILRSAEDVRLSVATLATSRHSLHIKP